MTDKPSEILARTADILMERGWVQGAFEDAQGRLCLLGALERAHPALDSAWVSAVNAVSSVLPGDPSIPVFNDRDETTFDMVLGALHDAQLAAKEAGQ